MPARSLGTLTLDLIAKVGGFERGMDRAERASKKAAKNTQQSWKSASTAIKTAFGAIAGIASARAIIQNTVRQEQAVAQLEARLRSTGGVAGLTSQQLQSMASSMQAVTTFGDEAVIEMQALLLTFTNIRGEIFERATPAILDLATAMGSDLKSASIQLGKALNDPVKGVSALAKSGIQFTESQKEMIKALVDTGQTAKAQEIILKELETQFGGAAEAAADTLGGALQQVQNAFGDLLEADGGLESSKEALQDLRDLLADPATIEAAKTLTGGLITAFGAATKAITETVNAVKFVGEELAAKIAGPSADDIVRLQERAEEINEILQGGFSGFVAKAGQNIEFGLGGVVAGLVGSGSEELRAELDKINTLIADFQSRQEQANRKLKQETEENTKASEENTVVVVTNTKEREKQAKQLEKALDGLREQSLLLGKTTEQQELYKLELLGATEAELAEARALLQKIDAFEKQEKAQEKALEAQKERQENYKSLVAELRTDEEKLTDQLEQRLNVLEAINNLPPADRQQIQGRIAAGQFTDAPEFGGSDSEQGEIEKLNKAQERLDEWYQTSLERLAAYREKYANLNAEWNEQEIELQAEYQEQIDEINQARFDAQLAGAESLFGNLADLAGEYAGKQSDAFRALFAIEKAVAIARSIVAINTAIAQASASAPFPANLGAMASVAAATAGLIANIKSAVIGQAHDGIDSVPNSGTWLLERGERVTTAETSAKLDRTLDEVKASNDESMYKQSNGERVSVFAVLDENTIYDLMQTSRAEQIVIKHFERNRNAISGAEA